MSIITERTPLVVAAEINSIRNQTGKILLVSAIEIGSRLSEAKNMLQYGEWLKWLSESVNYSERTAQRLMGLFEAYGENLSQQPNSLDTTNMPNLNYTQALILLGISEEERTQLIAEIDVESMSSRELQKVVQERSHALEERNQVLQEKTDLQIALDDQVNKVTQLTSERDGLRRKAEELRKYQIGIETKVGKLSSELNSVKKSSSYEHVQRMTKNLTEAYFKTSANKVAFLYESLDKTFKDLVWELGQLSNKNPEVYEEYKNKLTKFLAKNLDRI
nr:DUF3102 domain-containing protein [Desulfitobacterium dichloroeliminans]